MALNLKKYQEKLEKIKIIVKSRRFKKLVTVSIVVASSWFFGAILGTEFFNFYNIPRYNISREEMRNKVEVKPEQISAEPISKNKSELLAEQLDASGWKAYRNSKYEFELKYPKEWTMPKEEYLRKAETGFEYKISFKDFNILIQNNSQSSIDQSCNNSNSYRYILASYNNSGKPNNSSIESGSCAKKEILILKDDFYFRKVYVYQVTKGKYVYDIIPKIANPADSADYTYVSVTDEVTPETVKASASFKFKSVDPIVAKPKSVSTKSRISAPKPVSFAVAGGRMVCAKKNDHPGKSKQGKGKHMDMECCLDPDEYPNPHCYYPPKKYGKYL